MLSKNVEWTSDYDVNGLHILKIWKKKGKLSLDEIQTVASIWSEGEIFAWVFKEIEPSPNEDEFFAMKSSDYVEIYTEAEKYFNNK